MRKALREPDTKIWVLNICSFHNYYYLSCEVVSGGKSFLMLIHNNAT